LRGSWTQTKTNVLIDLSGSFESESGFEVVVSPSGESSQLRLLLQQGIGRLSPQIRSIAASDTAGHRERELAAELLTYLEESEHG
jgi:hypothetical protein